MAETADYLFQSLVDHHNKQHTLSLTKYSLSWEATNKHSSFENNTSDCLLRHDVCIDLREVVGVKAVKIPPKSATLSLKKSHKVEEHGLVCIEMQPIGPVCFSVYVVQRSSTQKWRYRQLSFQCKDASLCQHWVAAIKQALKHPAFSRPQNLVVFVNPFSGKKKAVKLWREKVEPLFELADIKVKLIETERQNHARDLVQHDLDLGQVDGLICVGGDGLFSEILNGLLTRSAHEHGVEESGHFQPVSPDIRIGIIPAGSTNTIVYTTTGVCDVVTSTLHVIIGDRLGIDVNSVNVNELFMRYSVTLLGYGYMGDLLKDSDNIRWMGPRRYSWSGTKSFLANACYYGEVRYRLSPNSTSHPSDTVRCYAGCPVCEQAGEDALLSSQSISSSPSRTSFVHFSAGREGSINTEPRDVSDTTAGMMEDILVSAGSCPADTVSCSSYPSDSSEWRTVVGKFVAVNSVTMSCSCDLSPSGMSPFCHLGDGCMDLILVSECSRVEFLKFLLKTAKGEERHSLNFMQMHRVKEFSFRPLTEDADLVSLASTEDLSSRQREKLKRQTSRTSVWNCDGEVIHHPKISVRVHCQLVKLFARGVEDPTMLEDPKCQTCCHPTFERLK